MPQLSLTSKNNILYSRIMLGKARDLLVKARQKELAPFNISPQQAHILFILYLLGNKATIAELASHSDRELNTLSIQTTRMEKDGLIRKVREKPKSNHLRIELTAKGLKVYKNTEKIKSIKMIMSVLSKEERQQLVSLLEKIVGSAEKYINLPDSKKM